MQRRIGLVLPDWIEHCHYMALGARRFARRFPSVVIRDFPQQGNLGASPMLFRWEPHGVIIFADVHEKELLRTVRSLEVPTVNTSSALPADWFPSVHVDLDSLNALALEHFDQLDIQDVAFVGLKDHPATKRRGESFSELMEQRGQKARVCRLEHYVHIREGEPALERLIRKSRKPLGLACFDDIVAEYVTRVAADLGCDVPDDVAVLGTGDSNACLSCQPHLSSIRLPSEEIGYRAAELLCDILDGRQPPSEPQAIPAGGIAARNSSSHPRPEGLDIERALRFIRDNACKGINVSAVLAGQRVSRVTFDKQFKEEVGHTAAEEIRRVKIERAKQMLEESDLSITRIAGMCGFSSSAQFSVTFREAVGSTPQEYRKARA